MLRKIKQLFCRHKHKEWEKINTDYYSESNMKFYHLVCKDCGAVIRMKEVKICDKK